MLNPREREDKDAFSKVSRAKKSDEESYSDAAGNATTGRAASDPSLGALRKKKSCLQ